jgi:hypothetical protein
MKTKLAQFIKRKYGFKPDPTDETLKRLGMNRPRFNRLMENKHGTTSPFTAEELIRFMLWLDLDVPSSIKSLVDYESVANNYQKSGHQLKIGE